MNIGLYQSANAMQGLEAWQDQIAGNLSSSAECGYQRQETVFESYLPSIQPEDGGPHATQSTELVRSSNRTIFEAGMIRPTGNPLDFSIAENTFFTTRNAQGQKVYSRDGSFQLNHEGTLVNKRGYEVLADGSPITLDPNLGDIEARRDGRIMQGGVEIGAFDIVQFGNPQALTAAGGGFIEMTPGIAGEEPVEAPELNQGFLESSNVSTMEEMARLITLSRAYETHQKLVHAHDETMQKAIQYLNPQA